MLPSYFSDIDEVSFSTLFYSLKLWATSYFTRGDKLKLK